MPERKYFYCANKLCDYKSMQPIENVAEELEDCKLCKSCQRKGWKLKMLPVVVREKKVG